MSEVRLNLMNWWKHVGLQQNTSIRNGYSLVLVVLFVIMWKAYTLGSNFEHLSNFFWKWSKIGSRARTFEKMNFRLVVDDMHYQHRGRYYCQCLPWLALPKNNKKQFVDVSLLLQQIKFPYLYRWHHLAWQVQHRCWSRTILFVSRTKSIDRAETKITRTKFCLLISVLVI